MSSRLNTRMPGMVLSGQTRSGVVAARAPGHRDCDCLAAERISVKARLAALRTRKKQLQNRLRHRASLAPGRRRVAQALCVLQGGNPEEAITYAAVGRRCGPGWAPELRMWLLSWVGSLTSGDRTLWSTESDGCAAGRAVVSANKYLRELRLHTWVMRQNLDKGIAPTDAILMRGLATGGGGTAEPAAAVPPSTRATKHARQWLRRWRRRWGVSLARIAARQWMPDALTQQKARWSQGDLGCCFGDPDGPKSATRFCWPAKNRSRIAVAFWGPRDLFPPKGATIIWSLFGARATDFNRKERPLYGRSFGPAPRNSTARSDHYMVGFLAKNPFFGDETVQAAALWQWSNALHANVPPDKTVLRINMDETCIRLHDGCTRGNLVAEAVEIKRSPKSLTQNVSSRDGKASCTHVSVICDDMDLQALLPQVLLLNNSLVSARCLRAIKASLPSFVLVVRRARAWMNAEVMVWWCKLLAAALRPVQGQRQIILYLDCFRGHWTRKALLAMARCHFWVCLIPAQMTWALQPCDTHVFARYKACLRTECLAARVQRADGSLGWPDLLQAVTACITAVLHHEPWLPAFEQIGLVGSQTLVSARVLGKLGLQQCSDVGQQLPCFADFQCILPAGATVPISEFFACFTRGPRHCDAPGSVSGPGTSDALLEQTPTPWFGRTRSSSAQATEDVSTAGQSSSCHPRTRQSQAQRLAAAPIRMARPPRLCSLRPAGLRQCVPPQNRDAPCSTRSTTSKWRRQL